MPQIPTSLVSKLSLKNKGNEGYTLFDKGSLIMFEVGCFLLAACSVCAAATDQVLRPQVHISILQVFSTISYPGPEQVSKRLSDSPAVIVTGHEQASLHRMMKQMALMQGKNPYVSALDMIIHSYSS